MAKLPGVYELMATAASPAINFARGVLGYQDPFLTQTMQNRMRELESQKGPVGDVSYEDYGLDSSAGRFTGGLLDLAINNPVDFGLAGSVGKYSYNPEGRKGLTYDFTPDQDTGSTGNAVLDFINRGGLKKAISRMGTAEASDLGAIANLANPVSTTNQFPFKSVAELLAENAISNPFQRTDLIGLFDEGLTGKKDDEEENLTGLFDEGLTTGMPSFGSTQKAPTAFGTKRRGGGISDLFRALVGFAVPGLGLLTGGFDGIRSLNQKLQGSTFGRSRSMQEFFERKRNEKLGNVGPGGIGLSRSELVQRNFANRVKDLADAGDDDRGNGAPGPGETSGGTFGSSVNDASSFSDYS